MAVRLVERYGAELQPQPAVARTESARRWPRALSTPLSSPSRFSGRLGVLALAAGVAILLLAAAYAAGRGSTFTLHESAPARLGLAAVIGVLVTAVHKHVRSPRTVGYSLARAQTLLCVAGALTMILIDNSVARAFGIAGAASIVRFRTPVDDPTDATVLFLLLALGMASGAGASGLAFAGAISVCLLLITFRMLTPERERRNVTFELVGAGETFPSSHVHRVFARHGIAVEPAEWAQDKAIRVKYRAAVDETLALEPLGAELMNGAEGALQSVTWEIKKIGS